MNPRIRVMLFLSACLTVPALGIGADDTKPKNTDWPGWRGADRTAISPETGFLKTWPEDGPKLVLTVKGLGAGYGSVAVVGDKIYVLGSKTDGSEGDPEQVMAFSAKDGKKLWATSIGKSVGRGFMGYPCPRSTPTVSGNHVYAFSSDGKLACLTVTKGDVIWTKNIKSDFGGKTGMWNYAESPLVDGDRVVITPGGDKAPIVCLGTKDGKEVWRSEIKGLKLKASTKGGFGKGGKGGKGGFKDRSKFKDKGKGKGGMGGFGGSMTYTTAGYSSVIIAEPNKTRQYIQFLTGGVVGIDAKTGKLLWHYDEPSCGMTNCSTPIYSDNAVFAASGYNNGGGRATLNYKDGKFVPKADFFSKEMQNQHGGMVLVNGYVYGTGSQAMICLDFKTGKVMWTKRMPSKGSVAAADGHIYFRAETGPMLLIEANPKEYKEKGRFTPPGKTRNVWAHPAIAGGKLYLRDWDKIFVYDIKAKD